MLDNSPRNMLTRRALLRMCSIFRRFERPRPIPHARVDRRSAARVPPAACLLYKPSGSQHWGDGLDRVLRGDDGDNFKLYKVLPLHDPLLEQSWVIALHELKAAVEVRLDPTPHVLQAGG